MEIPSLNKESIIGETLRALAAYTTQDLFIGSVDFIFNNGANDVLAIKQNGKCLYPVCYKYVKVIIDKKIVINHEII